MRYQLERFSMSQGGSKLVQIMAYHNEIQPLRSIFNSLAHEMQSHWHYRLFDNQEEKVLGERSPRIVYDKG